MFLQDEQFRAGRLAPKRTGKALLSSSVTHSLNPVPLGTPRTAVVAKFAEELQHVA